MSTRRFRIVQLIAGDGRGGADRIALALGTALKDMGHDAVYAVKLDFIKHHDVVGMGHELIEYPQRGSDFNVFKKSVKDADILLTHDSGSRHLGLRSKLSGVRPELWFMRHCISGTSRFGGVLLHRLFADQQIAVSSAVAESIIESGYPAKRVHCIHGGVDLLRFSQASSSEVSQARLRFLNDVSDNDIVIGMVARFNIFPSWKNSVEDLKGYDLMFSALSDVDFSFRVLVLGPQKDEDHEALRQMAQYHGLDPSKLIFAGFVHDLTSIYPLMGINVLPSRGEGLGLGAIEGMAAGVATITSDAGGLKEIIRSGENGLIFPSGNARELAFYIQELAHNHELRKKIAAEGQRDVLERFGIERMASSFVKIINDSFSEND